MPQFIPCRCERCVDDVGGKLKGETRDQPPSERQPDSAPVVVGGRRAKPDAHDPDHRFESAKGDDCDRDRFDRERNIVGDFV
jgi:hypothetical protein